MWDWASGPVYPYPFQLHTTWFESDWMQLVYGLRRLDSTFQTLKSVAISAPRKNYAAVTKSPPILQQLRYLRLIAIVSSNYIKSRISYLEWKKTARASRALEPSRLDPSLSIRQCTRSF